MDARKDPLNAGGLQPEHVLEQTCEHGAIVSQNGIVAVLKKAGLVYFDLFAQDTAAVDPASHHPVHAAVAMIGAAVAIFPEGASELGDHDDNGLPPSGSSDLLGKPGQRTA